MGATSDDADTLFAITLRSIANNVRVYLRCHTPLRSAELRITSVVSEVFKIPYKNYIHFENLGGAEKKITNIFLNFSLFLKFFVHSTGHL